MHLPSTRVLCNGLKSDRPMKDMSINPKKWAEEISEVEFGQALFFVLSTSLFIIAKHVDIFIVVLNTKCARVFLTFLLLLLT